MDVKKKRKRRLEEVAHLFLSRPSPPDQTTRPASREFQADSAITSFPDRIARTPCLLFASNSFFAEQTFLVCNLAIELARQGFSVGIVETVATVPSAFFLLGSHSSSTLRGLGALKLIDIASAGCKKIKTILLEKGFDPADCLTTVNSLARDFHFLIINASSDIFKLMKLVYPTNPFFILPVMVNSKALIETGVMIKQIAKTVACPEIGLLMIEESRSQKAEVTFNTIETMARGVLSADIHFMGTIPRGTDLARPILTRTPVLLEAGNAPVFKSIRKLTDSVLKKCSS